MSDRSHTPYFPAPDLCQAFGVSQSTGLSKSKQVRVLLDIDRSSLAWVLPSRVREHPLSSLVMLENGMLLDARSLPRDEQVLLCEAGMIPCVFEDLSPPGGSASANSGAPAPQGRHEERPGTPLPPESSPEGKPVAGAAQRRAPDPNQLELF
jgi:hypothetical protein